MTKFEILDRIRQIEKLYRSEITPRDEIDTMMAFNKLIKDLETDVKLEKIR